MKVNDLFENDNVSEMCDMFIREFGSITFIGIDKHKTTIRHIRWFNEHNNNQTPSRYQQYLIDRYGLSSNNAALDEIFNPTIELQHHVSKYPPKMWIHLKQIDNIVLKKMLTDTTKIDEYGNDWMQFVKEYFKDNQLLMNKWLKYGETIRNEI